MPLNKAMKARRRAHEYLNEYIDDLADRMKVGADISETDAWTLSLDQYVRTAARMASKRGEHDEQ